MKARVLLVAWCVVSLSFYYIVLKTNIGNIPRGGTMLELALLNGLALAPCVLGLEYWRSNPGMISKLPVAVLTMPIALGICCKLYYGLHVVARGLGVVAGV